MKCKNTSYSAGEKHLRSRWGQSQSCRRLVVIGNLWIALTEISAQIKTSECLSTHTHTHTHTHTRIHTCLALNKKAKSCSSSPAHVHRCLMLFFTKARTQISLCLCSSLKDTITIFSFKKRGRNANVHTSSQHLTHIHSKRPPTQIHTQFKRDDCSICSPPQSASPCQQRNTAWRMFLLSFFLVPWLNLGSEKSFMALHVLCRTENYEWGFQE